MRAERHEVGQQDSNAHLWHVAAGITGFAVILGLVGAGFAWTFARRSSERLPLQEIGTIASPDRPAKVPPVAIEALQPEQGATVSNGNEGAPMGKVVASEEQPIAPPNAKFSAEEAQVAGGKPESASAKTNPHAVKTLKTAAAPAASKVVGGLFAAQFGVAGSKAEARDIMRKVARKYGSQIGGRRLGYHHVKGGGKSLYRVEVGGMSKEAAAVTCEKVKWAGGYCFVTGN